MSKRGRNRKGRGATPIHGPLRRWRGFGGLLVGLVVAALVVVVAAAVVGGSGGSESDGNGRLPAYAYNSPMTLAGYQAAASARGPLSAVPCYCGCGPGQGHTSLENCFFSPEGTFTDHASNCHLCVEEAADVGKWFADGITLKDIRGRIESKYSDHGPPTNTPPL